MQAVNNRKDRTGAAWRFAALYVAALALPTLLMVNALTMQTTDSSEKESKLEDHRKLNNAVARLSQIAVRLNALQQMKPPYGGEPADPGAYDQLRLDFKNEVEAMKEAIHADSTLRKINLSKLVYLLENNHKTYDRIGEEFDKKVDEEVQRKLAVLLPPGRSEGGAEVAVLTAKLQSAQEKVTDLKVQLAKCGTSPAPGASTAGNAQLTELREKNRELEGKAERAVKTLNEVNAEFQIKEVRKREAKDILARIAANLEQYYRNEKPAGGGASSSNLR